MTAVNVLIHENAAHLLTDGAGYDIEGTLLSPTTKVQMLPHLNAAVAGRGAAALPAIYAQALGSVSDSFDEAKGKAVQCLREVSPLFGLHPTDGLEVVVAGISEARGPEAYAIFSHDRYGIEPYTIADFDMLGMTPGECVSEFLASLPNGAETDPNDIDPAVDGLRLLEMQRGTKVDSQIGNASVVGCFAQLTTITRDGISTRILKRWDDVRGQKIGTAQ